MTGRSGSRRFEGQPEVAIAGRLVPVATGLRARLLGLSGLEIEEAGPGLLIPHCASVHTFGMRFALDLHFIGSEGEVLASRRAVGPRRIHAHRGASAVLELPAGERSRGP